MAKYYGKVGFMVTVKTSPGVFIEEITERAYYGDIIKRYNRWEPQPNQQNDNLTISNQISILADDFAYEHISNIRYVEWLNQKWKVPSVDVDYPRLTLSIGGVYNGDDA